MKIYFSLFKLRFINGLQYRAAALAGISTQFFFGFVFISVYIAFFESNNTSNSPMELSQIISYLWLNQAFLSLIYTWTRDNNLISLIKNGNISYEFVRPINFYKKWFVSLYANRLSNVLLRFPFVVIVALFLPKPYNLLLPKSFNMLLIFLVLLLIGSLIVNSFTIIIHLMTFYTIDEKGIVALFMVISEIFAGGTVPLALFPKYLRFVANILPFKYTCDLPFMAYVGGVSISSSLFYILTGLIWLIILIIIGYLISKNISKKVVILGG